MVNGEYMPKAFKSCMDLNLNRNRQFHAFTIYMLYIRLTTDTGIQEILCRNRKCTQNALQTSRFDIHSYLFGDDCELNGEKWAVCRLQRCGNRDDTAIMDKSWISKPGIHRNEICKIQNECRGTFFYSILITNTKRMKNEVKELNFFVEWGVFCQFIFFFCNSSESALLRFS